MNFPPVQFGGMALGAASMYLLDPVSGHRRRSVARQKSGSRLRSFAHFLDMTSRDLKHRSAGLIYEARYQIRGRRADDDQISRRVAAKIGRYVSHPRALQIACNNGSVALSGLVLEHEVAGLIQGVKSVPGVKGVRQALETHKTGAGIPALQGGRARTGARTELRQTTWSPATRLLCGLAGASLILRATAKPSVGECLLGGAGLLLLGRSVANLPLKQVVGAGKGRRVIDFEKTLHINLPTDDVFAFFSDLENFPHFMRNIREVRDQGDDRTRWTARGPGGIDVTWTAAVTRLEPQRVIAWKSERGSQVANSGVIQFEPLGDQATRVSIRMSYNPPAGVLGHAVATFFGANPKQEMDADLARVKTFLETGHAARGVARPHRRSAGDQDVQPSTIH